MSICWNYILKKKMNNKTRAKNRSLVLFYEYSRLKCMNPGRLYLVENFNIATFTANWFKCNPSQRFLREIVTYFFSKIMLHRLKSYLKNLISKVIAHRKRTQRDYLYIISLLHSTCNQFSNVYFLPAWMLLTMVGLIFQIFACSDYTLIIFALLFSARITTRALSLC